MDQQYTECIYPIYNNNNSTTNNNIDILMGRFCFRSRSLGSIWLFELHSHHMDGRLWVNVISALLFFLSFSVSLSLSRCILSWRNSSSPPERFFLECVTNGMFIYHTIYIVNKNRWSRLTDSNKMLQMFRLILYIFLSSRSTQSDCVNFICFFFVILSFASVIFFLLVQYSCEW